MVSGADPVAAASAGAAWLSRRFGCVVALAETPASVGGGLDNWVHLVRFSGPTLPKEWTAPLVARVQPSADRTDQARAEAAVQDWCAARGFPTPRVLAVLTPEEGPGLPMQLMERVAGVTMLDAVRARPREAFSLARRLAVLHAQLHELPVDEWEGEAPSLLEARLRLVRVVADLDDDIAAGLVRVESLAPALERGGARAVCHGDFHPLNVLVDGGQQAVLDWSDAGIGDRHGDVARSALLFRLAAIASEDRIERAVLGLVGPILSRAYQRAYREEAGAVYDPVRVRLWTPVHLLHGWAQATAVHAGLFDDYGPSDERSGRIPPKLVGQLRRRFEKAMARAVTSAAP